MDVLGIDVGGVIIAASNDRSDTSFFSDNFLRSTPTEGMFEAVGRLVRERFDGQAFIVSKCGKRVQAKTLAWLEYHRFYERTGLPEGNVRFTLTREGKAPICEEIGITHFVDDRLDVLRHLHSVPYQFLFEDHPNELKQYAHLLPQVHHVHSWCEVVEILL